MPNQLNYPDPLRGTFYQRPDRFSQADLELMQVGQQQVLFGITERDVVETWVYNPDGTIAGHVNFFPADTALSLVTLIDQTGPYELLNVDLVARTAPSDQLTGPYELLNVDLVAAMQRMAIQPGRYAMVVNFFRDEVGSEAGYKLYISDISEDRTELQLYPVQISGDVIRDLYEFVVPSVPKTFANGLVDQFFGQSQDALFNERISWERFEGELNTQLNMTREKVAYAQREDSLRTIYEKIVERAYPLALDNMASDVRNLNIQQIELETYIMDAVDEVIRSMVSAGEVDPHFALI